ncbi:hypothetical protein BKA70DRAFT_1428777 [Coprinopsis sp. MPI-PUGE-AT-0042]|nr:hypothetical protein BKA70DRAFT_1428777 [Coprinopsis sp. MPI-PUGE-AT-0042]
MSSAHDGHEFKFEYGYNVFEFAGMTHDSADQIIKAAKLKPRRSPLPLLLEIAKSDRHCKHTIALLDVFLPLIHPPRSDEEPSPSLLSHQPYLACGYHIFGLIGLSILFSEAHDNNKHLLPAMMSRIHRRRQLDPIFECMDIGLTWALSTRDGQAEFQPDTRPTRVPIFLISLMRNGFADKDADCGAISKTNKLVYKIILRLWLLKNVHNGARIEVGDPDDYVMQTPKKGQQPDPMVRSLLAFLNGGNNVATIACWAEYSQEQGIFDGEARLADSIVRRLVFVRRCFKKEPDLYVSHWDQLWELHYVARLLCHGVPGGEVKGFSQALFNRELAGQGFLKHMVTIVRNIGSRTMDVSLDLHRTRGHPATQGLCFLDRWLGILVISVLAYPNLAVPCFTEMYTGYRLHRDDHSEADPWDAAVAMVPGIVRFCVHPSVVALVHADMATIPPKTFKAASNKLAGFLKAKTQFVPNLEEVRERVAVWHAGLENHRLLEAGLGNDTRLCDNPSHPTLVKSVPNEEAEEDMKRCARCRAVVYCSTHCQTAHWKTQHRETCEGLAMYRKDLESRWCWYSHRLRAWHIALTKWLYAEQVEKHFNDHTADIILTMSIPSTQLSSAKVQRANFFPVGRYDTTTQGASNNPDHAQRLRAALKRAEEEGKREARSKGRVHVEAVSQKYRVVEGFFYLGLGSGTACITLPVHVRKGEEGGFIVEYLETLTTIMELTTPFGNPYIFAPVKPQ